MSQMIFKKCVFIELQCADSSVNLKKNLKKFKLKIYIYKEGFLNNHFEFLKIAATRGNMAIFGLSNVLN